MQKEKSGYSFDSFLWGILISIITPIVSFGIITMLFEVLADAGLMDHITSSGASPREKTVALLAICCNLIPFNYFKNQRMDYAIRGCILPTMILVAYWLYRYRHFFF